MNGLHATAGARVEAIRTYGARNRWTVSEAYS